MDPQLTPNKELGVTIKYLFCLLSSLLDLPSCMTLTGMYFCVGQPGLINYSRFMMLLKIVEELCVQGIRLKIVKYFSKAMPIHYAGNHMLLNFSISHVV